MDRRRPRLLCCAGLRSSEDSDAHMMDSNATPDDIEMATHINPYERKLIKDSAEIVFREMQLQKKGVPFLIAFFKAYPHHQKQFKTFRGIPPDELRSLPETENHGRRVINQISLVVAHLEEHDMVKDQLVSLASRHAPRNVKPRQMKDMLEFFIVYLKLQLGSNFGKHHEAAWQKLMAYMLSTMEVTTSQMNTPVSIKEKICMGELGNNETEQGLPG